MGKMVTITGNQAAAHVAYAFSEVAAIYPITPSSDMGEFVDAWSAQGRKNMWGQELSVVEMQSEAGAAGAVHGSLSAGAMTTTFTASQGLFLMIPNMYKIAGEMIPTVFHVSARAVACQSLAIFGDHSDVMSVRNTGFALLAEGSIQEVMDLSLVAHLATLKAEIPFLSFFDGFRTSHEIQKIEEIGYDDMKSLVEMEYVEKFRNRALRPEQPYIKVAAQNPDVYFQGRETVNPYYEKVPGIVQEYMDKVAKLTGRQYHLVDYYGAPDAEKVIVAMGSAIETIEETVDYLNANGQKVGLLKIRLYRPFPSKAFLDALPPTVKKIAVLDRTKEPGSLGEPLYQDVVTILAGKNIKIVGGRYGLASKEFTPSMVNAVYKHLDSGNCFHDFTVGINDDVTGRSLDFSEFIHTESSDVTGCMFWGLGSDGTVGANKDSIKIIGDNTDMYAQGYFVYDSKKSYGITISHLRFGKTKIRSPYEVMSPKFVACHNSTYIGRYAMLEGIQEGGVFLLNSAYSADEVFNHLSRDLQEAIINKKLKFYNVDALKISKENGLGARINTVMATAFFAISGILPMEQAIEYYKAAIKKTFGRKGEEIVQKNWKCVDAAVAAIQEIKVPEKITESFTPPQLIKDDAPAFAQDIIKPSMYLKGNDIPVSKMTYDGSLPSGTSCLEKRRIAPLVPKWLDDKCIQCNQCVNACPHAVIRAKLVDPANLGDAPASFNAVEQKPAKPDGLKYKIQVYIDDCTSCGVCIDVCPAKEKALVFSPIETEREAGEEVNYKFFEALPDNVLGTNKRDTVKGSGFLKPLFEFSGACAGCGETPYVRLMTQLFGERMVASNATGCSSIYGGTFPTIPYCKTKEGRGPTWANSLFEDNAENGFGMRLAIDFNREQLKYFVNEALNCDKAPDTLKNVLGAAMALWDDVGPEAIAAQDAVKAVLAEMQGKFPNDCHCNEVLSKITELQDYFVDKSVWIIGGDGWAYDIGFGGLDHVVASGRNINILVLDTEVYSNTGGQASKATPIGAVAKFATGGKRKTKKNLGFMCMSYGDVYVASVAMGANRNQTLKAFIEAEAHKGPSILMCYSPCIAHGLKNMMFTQTEQKRAVAAGYWPLYRYNPALEKPFVWETPDATENFQEFIRSEGRYQQLQKTAPQDAERLYAEAEEDCKRRMEFYKKLGEVF